MKITWTKKKKETLTDYINESDSWASSWSIQSPWHDLNNLKQKKKKHKYGMLPAFAFDARACFN